MVRYYFTTTLMILILGFISGVCMTALFMGCRGCTRSTPKTTTVKEIKKTAANSHAAFQKRAAQLDTAKASVKASLVRTSVSLQHQTKVVAVRKAKLKRLLEPKGFPAKKLLQKTAAATDPEVAITDCDSLIRQVTYFLDENDRKDSLYETKIASLDSLVLVQDGIIQNDSLAYRNLQALFHQAITTAESLETENLNLNKKLKRQKLKGKLVSIGLMILSGAAANYLIHH